MALLDAGLDMEEAFARALPGQETRVARIVIRQEEICGVGVRAGDDHRGHAEHVGSQTRGHQLVDGSPVETKTLPPRCPHFLADDIDPQNARPPRRRESRPWSARTH